jgi:DDE superfamily endonuclease/Helix-turn-helix of DDE superfamily endonuclease
MKEHQLIRFKRVRHNTHLFMAMTSLNLKEFLLLLPSFRDAWNDYKQQHRHAGRPNQFFCIEDMLLFILYYLKCYPLQEVLAYSFGMSQGDANYWIHLLALILRDALGRGGNLPERLGENLKESLEAELKSRGVEKPSSDDEEPPKGSILELGIDGTERRILRPSDNEIQREFYSGKAKAHTVRNILIADLDQRRVYGLSGTVEGKRGEVTICKEAGYEFPDHTEIFVDKGFQGYHPQGATMFQPKKKPKDGELTEDEAKLNSIISGCRIVIEHIISGIKRLRIVKDLFRNTKDRFDDLVMELACGLHNFREQCRAPSR